MTEFAKIEEILSNDSLQLNVSVATSESRAVILEATAKIDGKEIPSLEEWLQSMTNDELKKMWVNMESGNDDNYEEYWNSNYGNYADVNDYYENYSWGDDEETYYMSDEYMDEYEMMIAKNKVDNDLYNSKYSINYMCNGETITGRKGEFVISKNGNYTVTATKGNETKTSIANITNCLNRSDNQVETFSYPTEKTQNYILAKDGYEVVIPAGFAYGISANVGTVTKGLVITDSIDENGHSTGNEFVWIPIDKTNLTVGNTNKKMAELQDGSSTNYRGVLYDWRTDSTGNTTYSWSSNSTDYREPAFLTGKPEFQNGGDNSSYNDGVIEIDTLQTEYNAMIEKVKLHGGFYVARYEMGKGEDYSKIGTTPTSASASDENMWYGLYTKAKSYNKVGVTSGMIWGSQYDAMLNFGLTNSIDSVKVNSDANGNHSGIKLKTGTYKGSDSINNIFDIEGNMYEWTKEAWTSHNRVKHGFHFSSSGGLPTSRTGEQTHSKNWYDGTRITLYIN